MKKLLAFLTMALISTSVMAATHPINLSLTPDVAIYDRTDTIEGVTLSIWGENPQKSLALGIANGFTDKSIGFGWGILNYADSYKGVQFSMINYTDNDAMGFFSSFVNFTKETFIGLQAGGVNYAGYLKGVQFGLVNYADDGKSGVQIGFINVMPKNEWFSKMPNELAPGMIFVNWRF